MRREFIAHSTKMLRFPARSSTSASSHHGLSLAAYITNIAESDFRYTHGSISKSVTRHGMDGFIDSFWKQRLIIYLLRKKRDMETLTPQRFQNDDRKRKP